MRNCLLVFVLLLLSFCGYGQCTLSVSLTASSPSICSGNKVTLTASASGGTGTLTYIWSTGEIKPTIDVNKEATYTVSVSDKTPGCQPVKKSIAIKVSPTPDAPTAANKVVCPNTPATLEATAPGGFYQWYGTATGDASFLQDGARYTTNPITSNKVFYVQTTIGGCTSARTPVSVTLTSKPNVTGASICAGNRANLSVDGGDTYKWYDNSAATGLPLSETDTYTTPVLQQTTTYYVVAVTGGCTSQPTAVIANVTPKPQTPVVLKNPVPVCSGSKANLHAEDGPGVFAWFDVPTGGTPLIFSPDFTTPALTTSKTYYVQNSINDCESSRTAVRVTVNPVPAAPASQVQTTCAGTSITLTMPPLPSGSYQWYDSPTATIPLITANSYKTPVLNASTNYYVLANNGGCSSTRTQIQVIINPAPPAPSVSGGIICYNTPTTLTPSGPGGTYKWYTLPAGGTPFFTGSPYNTPPLKATTTYYVATTLDGCTSARSKVIVTVSPPVAPPTGTGETICSGNQATLTAAGGSGGNYDWFATKTGGASLASTQTFQTQALTVTTTYYVQYTADGCPSTRTAVIARVTPIPTSPTVTTPPPICPGTTTTLTASTAAGNSIKWYADATGGTPLKNSATFPTPVLNVTTTYYAESVSGTCTSSRTPVTVKVNSPNEPQFQYPTGTVCTSAPNQVPVINNPKGGTFTASPAGLVINSSTGEINVGASAIHKYTITFTGNGACVVPESAGFSIGTVAIAQFKYNTGYCQDTSNPLPVYIAGGSGGTFSASPAGLVFVNTSTGEINLKKSQPGPYTITNEIAGSGACLGDKATASVSIYQSVAVNAGDDQTGASGTPAQLGASITGAAGGKWSGGTGSFSNPNILNPVYTPGAAETSATLTFTSDDPAGLCGPKSDKVVITFKTSPAGVTVTGNSTCKGSSANLSAIAPGGTYHWYDVPAGGIALSDDPTFLTPVLLSDKHYYVEATNSVGVTGPRTDVLVTVNDIPAAPVVTGPLAICTGNTTTLTTNDPAGNYKWYSDAAGTSQVSATDTYVTPALTSDQSYYVQKTVNGCISPMTKVDVTVSPIPSITSGFSDVVCSGNPLNYTITSNDATATFKWSRALVAGISNPAVTDQTTNPITETLINTASTAVDVKYIITPENNGCSGAAFTYTVTVYPTPTVTGSNTIPPICNGTPVNYAINFNTPAGFEWSRAAVPGIDNTAVSGQAASTIKEALFNSTTAPIDVKYLITSKTSTCPGTPFTLTVTVNPAATVTSVISGTACSSQPQNYQITANIPAATFTYSRDVVNNISNDAVSNVPAVSGIIDETLKSTGSSLVKVVYIITPYANGCPGTPFNYTVTVSPEIPVFRPNINSPVCVGSTFNLRVAAIPKATYLWTAPNGKTYAQQNVDIPNVTKADEGAYTLQVTVNGCTSAAVATNPAIALVNDPPTAFAGATPHTICITDLYIPLEGKIGGGAIEGIWSVTDGTGTFFPSVKYTEATKYIITDADRANKFVTLTLTSSSKDDCFPVHSDVRYNFGPLPAVDAGPDQNVCIQTNNVQLNGSATIPTRFAWITLGSGNFISGDQKNAVYVPSAADAEQGYVKLVLQALDAGKCEFPTDTMRVNFIPPPAVSAGGTRYVLKNRTITLNPTVSDNNVKYLWTPNVDINDNTVKNPVITGVIDREYTLQVTDSRGCVAKDSAFIKVSPEIVIPNTFTPNGDGYNDLWNIEGLIAYSDATVDIFTRYGQKVFHSIGYDTPWDGVYNGKQLPTGVYYYVIDTKMFNQVLSGSITIIR